MKIKDIPDWTLIYWFHLFSSVETFVNCSFKGNCSDMYMLAWFMVRPKCSQVVLTLFQCYFDKIVTFCSLCIIHLPQTSLYFRWFYSNYLLHFYLHLVLANMAAVQGQIWRRHTVLDFLENKSHQVNKWHFWKKN